MKKRKRVAQLLDNKAGMTYLKKVASEPIKRNIAEMAAMILVTGNYKVSLLEDTVNNTYSLIALYWLAEDLEHKEVPFNIELVSSAQTKFAEEIRISLTEDNIALLKKKIRKQG